MQLTMNELMYLKKFKTSDNYMSFFTGVDGTQKGDEEKTLTEKGALNEGDPSQFLKRVMMPLDDPEASSRLVIQMGQAMVEKYCYRKGADIAYVETYPETLNVTMPVTWDLAIGELAEMIPMTDSVMAEVESTFNPYEAAMLFLLLDLQRKNVALKYWGQDSKETISFEDLMAFMKKLPDGSLLKIASSHYGLPMPLESESMAILESLVRKGVISLKEGYELEGEYSGLAKTFSDLKCLTLAEILNKDGENMRAASFAVFSNGQNNHIWLDFSSDEITLKTVSGNYILKSLEQIFGCPTLI